MSDGIVGLSMSEYRPQHAHKVVNYMSKQIIEKSDLLNFRQKADLLYGLTSLDSGLLDKHSITLIEKLVKDINQF